MFSLFDGYMFMSVTDMLHTLSPIPRNLNFIEHTSDIGWKEYVVPPPLGQTNLSALNISGMNNILFCTRVQVVY